MYDSSIFCFNFARVTNRKVFNVQKEIFFMSLEVALTHSRKGSNPGGRCALRGRDPKQNFDGYFKYCNQPAHPANSSFVAAHQPVYEAATVELAKLVGLHAPHTFVLLNRNRDVNFVNWREVGEIDPSGRDYYFVSRWMECPLNSTETGYKLSQVALQNESPYLEALKISDIQGKKNNYFMADNQGNPTLYYLDLGCSFVHAVSGKLVKPAKSSIHNAKELRHALNKLSNYALIKSNNGAYVDLELLPEVIRHLPIPTLNPRGFARIGDLITSTELDEIERDVLGGFIDQLSSLRDQGFLIQKVVS